MKVTLFMAISANGIIARPDYREDFLSRENWDSFLDCVRETGALIWGRKTHEKVRAYGPQYFRPLASSSNIVVSGNPAFTVDEPGFEVAATPQQALDSLAARGLRRATLSGGSLLNTAFARAGSIHEVVLNVEAVFIGRGIPLFAPDDVDLELRFNEMRQVSDRIVQLRYAVLES